MLTRPSHVSQNPFRIIRAVNPLQQLDINQKFQKYVSVSTFHCHRAPFMNTPFIAYKNNEWWHFVVRLGSPALIWFYCVCCFSLFLSLFLYFCVFYYLLRYWGKFINTYNKSKELFLGIYLEFRGVGCNNEIVCFGLAFFGFINTDFNFSFYFS